MRRYVWMCMTLGVLVGAADRADAQVTLNANATSNNGLSGTAGIFFDVNAAGTDLTITNMTTASSAAAGGAFTFNLYTRVGTALGGPVTAGPGSSPTGWTLLGPVNATQGGTANGISLDIDIPDIFVANGSTVGVALQWVSGGGPRYFGTGTGPYQQFTDSTLTLTTGDSRSAPFTTTGSWFAPRGLTGSLTYSVSAVPEPASLALVAAGAGLGLIRRRSKRRA